MSVVYETATAAKYLAGCGYRIFPIKPGIKGAPLITEWPTQATCDAAQVARWWPPHSQNNIAVVGGDGRLILDIDGYKPGCREALAALEAKHGVLPATRTVATPRGGEHRYYLAPDVKNSESEIGTGLDIKSNGGYVVGPWSYTRDGFYRVKDDLPIVPAPQWLIDLTGAPKPKPHKAPNGEWDGKLRGATSEQWDDIRSALDYLATRSEVENNKQWSEIGYALLSLGDPGREMWCEWSARAPGYGGPITPEAWWDSHNSERTRSDHRHLFTIAQSLGWINPRSRAAASVSPPLSGSTTPVPQPPLTDEWPEPINFIDDFEASPFDGSELPPELAEYPLLYAQQTGFDAGIPLVSAVVTAASAINDQIQLCADSATNWFAQARLWALVIGAPAAGKSPVQAEMLKPLWVIHKELDEEWREAMSHVTKETAREEYPIRHRVIIRDTTLEALSNILEDDERGLLVATDEFNAWLGTLDQYKNGGVGRDRGEWLRLFEGGPHTIERVNRGTVYVKNWGVSILTATTPATMKKLARHLPNDGLIQRFLIVLARRQQIVASQGDRVRIEAARQRYADLIRRLWCVLSAVARELTSGGPVS